MCEKRVELEALFVCLTPLQMVIAINLIKAKKLKVYGVVVLFIGQGRQYQYYYKKLSEKSSFCFSYTPNNSPKKILVLLDIFRFKRRLLNEKNHFSCKNLYIASIDNIYVQMLLSVLGFNSLYTFDDGFANLNYTGRYYQDMTLSIHKQIILRAIGNKYTTKLVRGAITTHYSIYKDKVNIASQIEYINVFSYEEKKENEESCEINIMIGQPLNEINAALDSSYINGVLEKFNIKYYFPHPRERYSIDAKFEIIYSEKIFEDYIKELYENSVISKINVYSFCSTILINLNSCDFVNLYCFVDNYIPEEIYKVFDNGYGINFITANII